MHGFSDLLFLWALGLSASVTLVPERAIGRYFHKFHSAIALAMVIVALILGRPLVGGNTAGALGTVAELSAVAFAISILLLAGVIHITTAPLKPDLLWIPVSIGVLFAAFNGFARTGGRWEGLLFAAHFLTMAAMLGTALVAMILGHWYLQNAALSFDHLVRLCRVHFWACVAKSVVAVALAVAGWSRLKPMLEGFDLITVGTRAGAGLAGAALLAWMALSCARSKANQSATGILYVSVFFVLVGEFMSMHLTFKRGLPL